MKLRVLHETFQPGMVADWMMAFKRLRKRIYRYFKGLKQYAAILKTNGQTPQQILKLFDHLYGSFYLHFNKEQVAHLLSPEPDDELGFHVDDKFGGSDDYVRMEILPEEIKMTGADIKVPIEVQEALIELTNNYRRHLYNEITDETETAVS